jgi:hypothetical protein
MNLQGKNTQQTKEDYSHNRLIKGVDKKYHLLLQK